MDGEWSVEKVLQSIIINCRSWRGDGLKVKAGHCWMMFKLGTFIQMIPLPFILQNLDPFMTDVYSIIFLVRTRESSRGVLYSICLAIGSITLVFFLLYSLLLTRQPYLGKLSLRKDWSSPNVGCDYLV